MSSAEAGKIDADRQQTQGQAIARESGSPVPFLSSGKESLADRMSYEADVAHPDLKSGEPQEVWSRFFREHRPAPALLSKWVLQLHEEKQYRQVIACLQSALVHGQAQPWMYEVLALSMEIEGYPKEKVERVVLSMSDFGQADYGSMMYSGAYLTRFGRKSAALRLYQQASRMLPERPEPYVLGLKLAKDAGAPEEIRWAATGILLNYWEPDFAARHREAENALTDEIRRQQKAGNADAAAELSQALTAARSRDLVIRLEWNGAADLDLEVEEPGGSVCSVSSPQTQGGGLFLHDGLGPNPDNSYELYVCPRGFPGPYRIIIRARDGKVVGGRATLTVTQREGLPDQSRMVRTLQLAGEELGLAVDLPLGRRNEPKHISLLARPEPADLAVPRPRVPAGQNPQAAQARRDFLESRAEQDLRNGRPAGAVGYAPVIQVIPEGSSLSAQAVVSPDRRYIRLGIQPAFTTITDVFTFSFLNGGQQNAGGGGAANAGQ